MPHDETLSREIRSLLESPTLTEFCHLMCQWLVQKPVILTEKPAILSGKPSCPREDGGKDLFSLIRETIEMISAQDSPHNVAELIAAEQLQNMSHPRWAFVPVVHGLWSLRVQRRGGKRRKIHLKQSKGGMAEKKEISRILGELGKGASSQSREKILSYLFARALRRRGNMRHNYISLTKTVEWCERWRWEEGEPLLVFALDNLFQSSEESDLWKNLTDVKIPSLGQQRMTERSMLDLRDSFLTEKSGDLGPRMIAALTTYSPESFYEWLLFVGAEVVTLGAKEKSNSAICSFIFIDLLRYYLKIISDQEKGQALLFAAIDLREIADLCRPLGRREEPSRDFLKDQLLLVQLEEAIRLSHGSFAIALLNRLLETKNVTPMEISERLVFLASRIDPSPLVEFPLNFCYSALRSWHLGKSAMRHQMARSLVQWLSDGPKDYQVYHSFVNAQMIAGNLAERLSYPTFKICI